jgi:HAE1 family hydrophobic/amphiphilic exporter-1
MLLTYMLLAAILESFIQPVFILLTVPLAIIGVLASLYYTHISFAITSMMAIIMLIGIVVNNAILMLDYTNQLVRERGMDVKSALIEACPTKLKPIIMSTIAIILGMLPLAIGLGSAGVEMRQPLGVVSIGGLMVSTLLTLFVIPAFYYVFEDRKKK